MGKKTMKIFIPSRGRANMVHTLKAIPPNLLKDTTLVVHQSEVGHYEEYNKNINILPTFVQGISVVRWDIALHCDNNNITHFVMLDDDLRFYRRKDPSTVSLQDADHSDMNHMFAMMRYYLGKFPCVGISARQGNNNIGIGSSDIIVDTNVRLLRAFGFRTKDYLNTIPNRVLFMEDFDVFLQLLRQGKPNLNLYWWAQDQIQTHAPGGCSTYRTQASHALAAQQLKNLHPAFVELVEKRNITGGEFGTRLEVRIQWKAAYQEGVKNVLRGSGNIAQRSVQTGDTTS